MHSSYCLLTFGLSQARFLLLNQTTQQDRPCPQMARHRPQDQRHAHLASRLFPAHESQSPHHYQHGLKQQKYDSDTVLHMVLMLTPCRLKKRMICRLLWPLPALQASTLALASSKTRMITRSLDLLRPVLRLQVACLSCLDDLLESLLTLSFFF